MIVEMLIVVGGIAVAGAVTAGRQRKAGPPGLEARVHADPDRGRFRRWRNDGGRGAAWTTHGFGVAITLRLHVERPGVLAWSLSVPLPNVSGTRRTLVKAVAASGAGMLTDDRLLAESGVQEGLAELGKLVRVRSLAVDGGGVAGTLETDGSFESVEVDAVSRVEGAFAKVTLAVAEALGHPIARTTPCPACPGKLSTGRGVIGEAVCWRCHGRFFPPAAAATLLGDALGLSPGELKSAPRVDAERLACPGCGGRTDRVEVQGHAIDVCMGCGALWLDAGELETLSGGRFAYAPGGEEAAERVGD